MRKIIGIVVMALFAISGYAQSYLPVNTYGYQWKRGKFDIALLTPQGTGSTLPSDTIRNGALRYNPNVGYLQMWEDGVWGNIASGTGIALDSARRSNDTLFFRYTTGGELAVKIEGLPISAIVGLSDSLYARIDTTRADLRYILNRAYPKQDASANIKGTTTDTLTISYPTAPNVINRQASGVVGVPGRSLAWFPSSATVSYTWWTDPTFWDMTLRRGAAGVGLWIGDDTTTNSALKVKAQGSAGVNNIITAKDTAGVRFLLNLMLHNGVARFSINDSIPPYSYSVWFNAGVGINKDSVPITSSASAVPMGIDTTTGQVVRFTDGGSGSYIQNLYSTTTPQASSSSTIDGSQFIIDGTVDLSSINAPSGSSVTTKPKILVARTVDSTSNVSDHTFADNSIFQKNTDGIAYNSFDAWPRISGNHNYDHYSAFQSRPVYNTIGTTTNHYGFYDVATINAGTLTNRFGTYIAEAVGAGTVVNNYGIFINTLTKGTNSNYSIYTGSATTRLGGTLQMANPAGTVGSGALINFTSGSTALVQASINHEVMSSTQGNLRMKVKTAVGVLTETITLLGGASYGVGVNTIAPTAKLHVTGTTRFDLGSDAKWDGFYRDSTTGNVTRDPAGTFGQFRYAGPGGKPVWRTLVAGDIPFLPFSQITGTVPISQGGTALTAIGTPLQEIRVASGGTTLEYFTPTPITLDIATTNGNTTSNAVTVGGIINNGNISNMSGSIRTKYRSAANGETLLLSDHTISGNTSGGNCTLTLPTGSTFYGIEYYIRSSALLNTLTIQTSGSDTISYTTSGNTSLVIPHAAIIKLEGSVWAVYSLY